MVPRVALPLWTSGSPQDKKDFTLSLNKLCAANYDKIVPVLLSLYHPDQARFTIEKITSKILNMNCRLGSDTNNYAKLFKALIDTECTKSGVSHDKTQI